MSASFFYVNELGKVMQTGTCAQSQLDYQESPEGWRKCIGSARVGDYLSNSGYVVAVGDPPSSSHVFDYAQKQWVLDADKAWQQVRAKRDSLLAATDWRVIKAQESGQPLDAAWQAYRQALRDITLQPDPAQIVWPDPPQP